jgi:cyclic pyranopterin monophosphate synthase
MKKLSHTDSLGKANMVDIGGKKIQTRIAKASGHISLAAETTKLIRENQLMKGDVLAVAQLAGINAAKQTQNLIPLCHNITIENVKVALAVDTTGVNAGSEVKSSGKTGVEMEALTAVSVALLTVYDMCKAVDKKMVIDRIELTEKIKK